VLRKSVSLIALLLVALVPTAIARSWPEAPRFTTPLLADDAAAPASVPSPSASADTPQNTTADGAQASTQRASIAAPESAPAIAAVGGGVATPVERVVAPGAVREHEHWTPMLLQSATFLGIQHAGNLSMDWYMRWNLLHGKFFQKYADSLKDWRWTRWNDDDPFLDDYIGHPIMGAITSNIWIQNDPIGRRLAFQNTREYWHSRLRAMAWSAAYSAQWKIGPLSEASLGNTGSEKLWDHRLRKTTNGTGMVDFVMTPVGGAAWGVAEDMLDRWVIAPVQRRNDNPGLMFIMSWLNPCRSAANILRFKAPWYRDYRNKDVMRLAQQ